MDQNRLASLEAPSLRLRESTLDVLWRQWRAVDAQAAGKGRARAMVDPEALVLMSLSLMDVERRLGDLVYGWAILNSGLLSVQRANNLAAAYPEQARKRLAWFAEVALVEGKDMRWQSIVRRLRGTGGAAAPAHRTKKQRAIRARLADPAALLLRLRLGIGVGAKSDVLGFLLGTAGTWASVRDLSSATGYTVAALRRATEDMAAARLIRSRAESPAAYRADPEAWTRVLGLQKPLPLWRGWHQSFAFVAAFLSWSGKAPRKAMSSYAASVKGRELMEAHRSVFDQDLAVVLSDRSPDSDWMDVVAKAVTALADWMPANA